MIHGFFDPASPWPTPRVRIDLFLPGFTTEWTTVRFLIDTGASTTCLHPRDAPLVGIATNQLADPRLWLVQEPYVGVGGVSICYVVAARLTFHHDDGHRQILEGNLRIAQLTPDNRTLPSLLGWDVLQHFELTTNWRDRRVTLDSLP